MSTFTNLVDDDSGLENLELEIKAANFVNKPNRVRLFSKLNNKQYKYILENLENIQLWMLVKSKYSSGPSENRVSIKTKWRHPNNVPVGIGDVSIVPDLTTENIATTKLFPKTIYNYGGDLNIGTYNRPVVGFGIGNGYYYTFDVAADEKIPVDISHSLTSGFVPTEFSLNESNLVTLLDGTNALQIDIYNRNFTDNLAYERHIHEVDFHCRIAGVAADRVRFNVNNHIDARKQRQFFKFHLTELKDGRKVDSKVTNQTLTAQLATRRKFYDGKTYSEFIGPRDIGFAVWS